MCGLCNNYVQIFSYGISLGCPEWNTLGVVPYKGRTLQQTLESEELQKARERIQQGRGAGFCKVGCPRYNFPWKECTVEEPIRNLMVASDETCNIRCKSCRRELVTTNPSQVQESLKNIEEVFGQTIEHLETSGSGDPFASPVMHRWIRSLSESKFPNLKTIKFQTNGLLLSEKTYTELPEFVRDRISYILLSIDAATKETYERIRVGGNWETLTRNIQFLSARHPICFQFVIQKDNYKEIEQFFNLCKQFQRDSTVLYEVLTWWKERISEEQFKDMDILSDMRVSVRKEIQRQLNIVESKGAVLQGTVKPFQGEKVDFI